MTNLIDKRFLNGHPIGGVFHWTAGTNKASALEKADYHFLIEGDGKIVRGVHSIADNDSTADGNYAPHTGGANTKRVAVALCGMAGAAQNPFSAGKYPINRVQWEKAIDVWAELFTFYKLTVTPISLLNHSEVFHTLHTVGKNETKWDVSKLAFEPTWEPPRVYHELRAGVINAMKA